MKKIPTQAIQEGIDALRQIVVLERLRARQAAKRVVVHQSLRGIFSVLSLFVGAMAFQLILFLTTFALYQKGWSVGILNGSIAMIALGFIGLLMMMASRVGRSAPWTSIVRKNNEYSRANRERTGTTKEAA